MTRFFIDAQGRRHWGEHGAAGLLAYHVGDDAVRYLLQKRSLYTHGGGTWSIPGGALNAGESPVEGAFRETEEELGRLPEGLAYVGTVTTDFGGWQYHTVVFRSPEQFTAPGNWEVAEHRWVTVAGMAHLLLHPGFAAAFPRAKAIVEQETRLAVAPSPRFLRNAWSQCPEIRLIKTTYGPGRSGRHDL